MLIPTVIQKEGDKERAYDLFSRLMKERIVFLGEAVNDAVANIIIAQMLFLESENNDEINLYINSPGGYITSGLAIHDTMRYVKPDIRTVCVGQASSMGAFLLSAGTPGKRVSLPNSRIMIHQPSGGSSGSASDIEIQAKEILKLKTKLNKLLATYTGQSLEQVEKDSDRDYFMEPEEALKYGIIDEIETSR